MLTFNELLDEQLFQHNESDNESSSIQLINLMTSLSHFISCLFIINQLKKTYIGFFSNAH